MHVINYFIIYWKPLAWSLLLLLVTCLSQFFTLPISGLYLLGYVVTVAISTTWVSFVTVQNFLHQNKPLNLAKLLNFKVKQFDDHFNNAASIKQLTLDIDKYFIEKWFVYISKDPTFSDESRVILEEILRKIINVQLNLDNEVIVQGVLNLYLKHLKEFRRSLKRRDKYSGKISDLYRYSHMCSASKKAKSYFIHQLTINLLNHFINWELGNSLPYQVLVSIISKKVMTYILKLLSNPEFINYYILKSCAPENKIQELNLNSYNRVKITKITEKGDTTPSDLVKSMSKTNLAKVDTIEPQTKEIVEFKTEDVKIYEPKSCKTWYDSLDLTSIPLGQDILDSISLGESDKDVDNTELEKEEVLSPISSAKNLLDEMKQMTNFEGLKTSMKPISDATATTIHNIKDFQESTVNNVVKPVSQVTSTALHRIGGLHLQDEAAGVVEGILDFGRTRIRKGLRLTGLQDSPPEEPIKPPKKQIVKMDKIDDFETTWINPVQEEQPKPETVTKVPSIQTHEEISPEPEYEEAADLATSIAKLRSLLEQKSSESSLSTPAVSPMPQDDISNKILLEDGDETDGVMPSFYKFCAKTATGVIHNTLNTIKTALPGNVAECDRYDGLEKWLFVEANTTDCDLYERMTKLLGERKVFCTVDTAYEALDSLESLQQTDKLRQSNIQFDDELDDFEVKLPITKTLFDILCELLADNKETSLTQEPVIKSILLLFGNYIEETVVTQANYYLRYCCANAKIPSEGKIETLSMELEEFVTVVLSGIPNSFKCLVGENTVKDVINLLVSSLQIEKINQDIMLQVFEILCMKLMEGSKQLSPMISA
ncbi:uncharacterized protein LOC103314394 [Tribolium castaneum]|uniref:PXA domain-containing protein n=1 Tax=Tribolium castaneum TaxID=7070 RepID=D6X1K5_TRICA|nr:PREDICTED: uncharacterized protein LOC103314394 [Tribolium castaneum]EFA09342.1 hypothetical protein TcasGA2_TC001668 [Tribolium castaneum]|eukprot:XP_008198593.1 PREDICTED: uncharacterized protein LOC103314394 [Tribolium castaneum]